jgi:hypothetical protein
MSPRDPDLSGLFKPNGTVSTPVELQSGALLRDKIKRFRPSYSGAISQRIPVFHLWRLRKPTEVDPIV